MTRKSLRMQQSEILEKRDGLDDESSRELWNERRGFEGEEGAVELLHEFGPGHWEILHDTWIQTNGKSQIDIIVATLTHIYVFEIKNYNGHYTYSKQQQYIDHKPINGNLFTAYRRARSKMSEVLRQIDYTGGLVSKVVFINPDHIVSVDEEFREEVLERHQFVDFIRQMCRNEAHSPRANLSPSEFRHVVLENFIGTHPYPPKSYSHAQVMKLTCGFKCSNCHRAGERLSVSRYKVCCSSCGFEEAKTIAVLRAVCEYGVLRIDDHLRARDICEFLGGKVSQAYISRLLPSHFESIPDSRFYYRNPGMIYDYYFDGRIVKGRTLKNKRAN